MDGQGETPAALRGGRMGRPWEGEGLREASVAAAAGTYLEPWASGSWDRRPRHDRCRSGCHLMSLHVDLCLEEFPVWLTVVFKAPTTPSWQLQSGTLTIEPFPDARGSEPGHLAPLWPNWQAAGSPRVLGHNSPATNS